MKKAKVQPEGRLKPIHVGVDPQIKPYVEEFMGFAAAQNVHFNHEVTMGFFKIKENNIIGWTYYDWSFREIDLDQGYWQHATETSKRILLFHESIHAYCGRDHDYGDGIAYPSQSTAGLFGLIDHLLPTYCPVKDTAGFFEDQCPLSIMHPVHIDDFCAKKHWDYYVKEMFNRCVPY